MVRPFHLLIAPALIHGVGDDVEVSTDDGADEVDSRIMLNGDELAVVNAGLPGQLLFGLI